MYDIGRKVYCKSQEQTGYIVERNWLYFAKNKRRAVYIVEFQHPTGLRAKWDFMTGSSDLSPADFCCESCDQYKPWSQKGAYHEEAGYFCWFCLMIDDREYGYGRMARRRKKRSKN